MMMMVVVVVVVVVVKHVADGGALGALPLP